MGTPAARTAKTRRRGAVLQSRHRDGLDGRQGLPSRLATDSEHQTRFAWEGRTHNKNITFVGTLTNGPGTVDGQPFPNHHEGHGGWKISQIAAAVDNAIATSQPHIVLLKIGTNDINGNDDINNAPNRLASLIDQITSDAPDALLVVSSIIPTDNDGTNQRVQAYNTAIQTKAEEAATAGKHVVFVDNYAAFAQNPNYKTALMSDGLHPNTAGYVVLGDSFYDTISPLLPDAP